MHTALHDHQTAVLLATRRHDRTGQPHCLIPDDGREGQFRVLPEATIVSLGASAINTIAWSSGSDEAGGLDPALLA